MELQTQTGCAMDMRSARTSLSREPLPVVPRSALLRLFQTPPTVLLALSPDHVLLHTSPASNPSLAPPRPLSLHVTTPRSDPLFKHLLNGTTDFSDVAAVSGGPEAFPVVPLQVCHCIPCSMFHYALPR